RRMIEACLDPRLAQEPRDLVLARRRGTQALDRDVAVELGIVREQDLAHAADADRRAELVAGEGRPRCAVDPAGGRGDEVGPRGRYQRRRLDRGHVARRIVVTAVHGAIVAPSQSALTAVSWVARRKPATSRPEDRRSRILTATFDGILRQGGLTRENHTCGCV